MSMYKAHKPILELKTTAKDWYCNILWVSLDKKKQKPVKGYVWNGKHRHPLFRNIANFYKYVPYVAESNAILVDIPTACAHAEVVRLKLTNRGQKCKIFMKYRRPTCNVSI